MWAFLQYLPLGCQRRLPAVSGSPACLGLRAAIYATIMTAAKRLSTFVPEPPPRPSRRARGSTEPHAGRAPALRQRLLNFLCSAKLEARAGRGRTRKLLSTRRVCTAEPVAGKSSSPANSEARGLARPFPPRVCRRPRCAAQDVAQPCGVLVRRDGPPLGVALVRPPRYPRHPLTFGGQLSRAWIRAPPHRGRGKKAILQKPPVPSPPPLPRRSLPPSPYQPGSPSRAKAGRPLSSPFAPPPLRRPCQSAPRLGDPSTASPPGWAVALLAEEPTSWLLVPAWSASPAAAPRATTPSSLRGRAGKMGRSWPRRMAQYKGPAGGNGVGKHRDWMCVPPPAGPFSLTIEAWNETGQGDPRAPVASCGLALQPRQQRFWVVFFPLVESCAEIPMQVDTCAPPPHPAQPAALIISI